MCYDRCSWSSCAKAVQYLAPGRVQLSRFRLVPKSDGFRGLLLKALVCVALCTVTAGASFNSTMLATRRLPSAAPPHVQVVGHQIHPAVGNREVDVTVNNRHSTASQQQQQQQHQQQQQQQQQQQKYQYQQEQQDQYSHQGQQQQQPQAEPLVLYARGHYSSADRPFRIVNQTLLESALKIFEQSEFSIMAKLQQKVGSQAILLSLDRAAPNHKRLLEIEISSQRAQVSIRYSDPAGVWREDVLPHVQLANNRFRTLALHFSGDQVALIVDCVQEGKISLSGGRVHTTQDAQVYLLGRGEANAFRDEVEYIQLAAGPHAWQRLQCPGVGDNYNEDRMAQFEAGQQQQGRQLYQLQHNYTVMRVAIDEMWKTLMPDCSHQGHHIANGSRWRESCNECICVNKHVTCSPIVCPSPAKCADPNLDLCCRVACERNCSNGATVIPHGTAVYTSRSLTGCVVKTCNDGVITFHNETCPPLACPEEDRVFHEGSCCASCRQAHCGSLQGTCVEHARCSNHTISPKCICDPGYEGDGRTRCEDIDECASSEGRCSKNSVCENTPGSYRCNCVEGYRKDAAGIFCIDINECLEKDFCDSGATCVNTNGGFECLCPDGYRSEGRACKPVCASGCQHGGYCKAPDLCACRPGYRGDLCQYDIDECVGPNMCGPHAVCINQPGHYYCQCRDGFQLATRNGTSYCADVDECTTDPYACPNECRCVNQVGSFACICPEKDRNGAKASWNCRVVDKRLNFTATMSDGSSFSIERGCTSYSCWQGTPLRAAFECNCSDSQQMQQVCCPHCFQEEQSQCRLRGKNGAVEMIANGQRVIRDCEICTCSFGNLRCSPPRCPSLSCTNPQQPPGLCCPICPDQDPCAPVGPSRDLYSEESRPTGNVEDRGCHLPAEALFIEFSQELWARIPPLKGEPFVPWHSLSPPDHSDYDDDRPDTRRSEASPPKSDRIAKSPAG